jgi:hypothetical protein
MARQKTPIALCAVLTCSTWLLVLPSAVEAQSPVNRPGVLSQRRILLPASGDPLTTVPGLNRGQQLQSIGSYPSLELLRTQGEKLSLTFPGSPARVSLNNYLNSDSSLSRLAQRLRPATIPNSLTGEAQILRSTSSLVLIERLAYQPTFNACSLAAGPASTLCFGTRTSAPRSRQRDALNPLRGDRPQRPPARVRPDAAQLAQQTQRMSQLSALLAAASQGSPNARTLPGWAAGLSRDQLRQLSQLDSSALQRVLLNNARVSITRALTISDPLAVDPALSKRLQRLRSIQSWSPPGRPLVDINLRPQQGTTKLGDDIYLTGFTFGDSVYWTERYEFELDYGFDRATVRFQPYASAHYGLGMRFPMEVKSTYEVSGGASNSAAVRVSLKPINANTDQYLSTALDQKLAFTGQELVAEIGADVGINWLLPILGMGEISFSPELDLTSYLPGPLRNGQFTPPSSGTLDVGNLIIPFDLLGGLGDYYLDGVGGFELTVKPGINIGLTSPDRGIQLVDRNQGNKNSTFSSRSGISQASVAIVGGTSRFVLKDPYYDLSMIVTPGLQVEGVLGVFEWNLELGTFIDFPTLAITIPSDGVSFSCHKGTICGRDYTVDATNLTSNSVAAQTPGDKTQRLRLSKDYTIRDDENGADEWYRRSQVEPSLTLRRGGQGQFKPSHRASNPVRCAGGEARLEDWDTIKVDQNGVARLWVSLELFEGTSCSNSDKDGSLIGVSPSHKPVGKPVLVVAPGQSGTAKVTVHNTDESSSNDFGSIEYTLDNRTLD